MGKNVLVISASPRKGGNSDTLCDEFVRGAEEAGHKAEKVFLCDRKIHYCTGCGACQSSHECILKDDMADVLDRMVRADVIVMATPVYFLHDERADENAYRPYRPKIRGNFEQGLLFHRDSRRYGPEDVGANHRRLSRVYGRLSDGSARERRNLRCGSLAKR